MSVSPEQGPHLYLPLLRLEEPEVLPRTLQLHEPDAGLVAWAVRVREALEPLLLLDPEGRVVAMSEPCGRLLAHDPTMVVGALLLDLLVLVDFTAAADLLPDPAHHLPPVRTLASGSVARGLVRVQRSDRLATYDVVGLPLALGAGALAYLSEV